MPDKIAFLFRTDVHVSDTSPASWKGDYPSEIWSDLEQIGEIAESCGATAVLDGGDYFHIKRASGNSHALMYRTAIIHSSSYLCPVYCVEGNHDLAYNNLNSVGRQPLGVLYASKVFRHLRDEVFTANGLRVRVVGVPYSLKRTSESLLAIQKQPGDDYLVAVVHALASESLSSAEGFFKEPVFHYADLITPNGPDVWAFGHWHQDQGVVKIGRKYFVNQGAVSRGALVHENLSRTPQIALMEFASSGVTIKTIPLRVAPAEEVFDLVKKARIESEHRSIDKFVEKLGEDAAFDSTATIEANIQSLDFAADVRELALAYLEQARSEK